VRFRAETIEAMRQHPLLVWMVRLWPSLLDAVHVVQPETVLRWHRAGVRAFWRWKSRNRAGIASIASNDALILPHGANLPGWGFRE